MTKPTPSLRATTPLRPGRLRAGIRALVGLAGLAWLAAHPAVGSAGDCATPRPSFTYSDSAGCFVVAPPSIAGNHGARLLVTAPNIFRYDYRLGLDGTDDHTASLPKALSDLLVTFTPAPAKGPELASDEEARSRAAPLQFRGTLWKSYGDQRRILAADSSAADSLIALYELGGADYAALSAAWAAPTNRKARERVLLAVAGADSLLHGKLAARLDSISDQEQGTQRPLVEAHIPDLVDEFNRQVTRAHAARNSRVLADPVTTWDEAVGDWQRQQPARPAGGKKPPAKPELPPDVERATKSLAAAVKALDARDAMADSVAGVARLAVTNLTALLAFSIESGSAADTLVREVDSVHGDELTVRVARSIRPVPELHADASDAFGKQVPAADTTGGATAHCVIVHKWSLDFSAGLGMTGFRTRGYFLADDPDTSKKQKILRSGGEDRNEIVPMAFAHGLWTFAPRLATGISLGVSVSDPIRYLAGGTLQYGTRSRVALTGGAAAGKTDVLVGEKVGQPATGDSPRTRSAWRHTWYGALTFTVAVP